MIADKDRSYYIGASDTDFVIRPWNTKTFERWWRVKQGYGGMNIRTDAMLAGTAYEHRILDSLSVHGLLKDQQKIIGRLRINLDGNTEDTIYEVKTYKYENGFKVPLSYKRQVNVQMYGFGIYEAFIVAYGLVKKDYRNYYRDIDKERLSFHRIDYDNDFINNIYLPRLMYLSECLEAGKFPKEGAA